MKWWRGLKHWWTHMHEGVCRRARRLESEETETRQWKEVLLEWDVVLDELREMVGSVKRNGGHA